MLFIHLVLSVFLIWNSIEPVEEKRSIESIVSALNQGSSSDLSQYFDSSITLNINGQQGSYSKNQAEVVLRGFFKKNPPQSFSVVYRSENNASLSSYVGEYQSIESSYKVFIKISFHEEQLKLYSLEFVQS